MLLWAHDDATPVDVIPAYGFERQQRQATGGMDDGDNPNDRVAVALGFAEHRALTFGSE